MDKLIGISEEDLEKPSKVNINIRKNGKVGLINNLHRGNLSLEGRRLLAKSKILSKKADKWSAEYREHIIYQIIYRLINPFPPKIATLANELGLTPELIRSLIRTKEYEDIKSELRQELRAKWGANIDQVVIKKALMGSKYHAELYYKLQKELIERLEVKKVDDVPENEQDRLKLISKMNKELGFDVRELQSYTNPSQMERRMEVKKENCIGTEKDGRLGKTYKDIAIRPKDR